MENIFEPKTNVEQQQQADAGYEGQHPDDEFNLPGKHTNPNKTNIGQPADKNAKNAKNFDKAKMKSKDSSQQGGDCGCS